MKFGLTAEQYQFIRETVVGPLEAVGAKVFCYGSRARASHAPHSDLDLMVEIDAATDLTRLIGDISETLENSNFPYKVDLVEFSHFAESYKENYAKEKELF